MYAHDPAYIPVYKSFAEVPVEAPEELKFIMLEDIEDDSEIEFSLVLLFCIHSSPDNYYPRRFYSYFFPNSYMDGYLPTLLPAKGLHNV